MIKYFRLSLADYSFADYLHFVAGRGRSNSRAAFQSAIENRQSEVSSLFFCKSHLLDIEKIQFNRSRASKNRDRNFQGRFILINFFDLAGEALERSGFDAYRLAC